MSDICPICDKKIKRNDITVTLVFHDRPDEIIHHDCYRDFISLLENLTRDLPHDPFGTRDISYTKEVKHND